MDRIAPPAARKSTPASSPAAKHPALGFATLLARVRQPTPSPAPHAHVPPVAPRQSPPAARGHSPRDEPKERAPRPALDEPLWTHRAALVAPPVTDVQAATRAHVEHVNARASIEVLAPQLLRRLAFGGDGRRGAARLELGSGAVLTLEAEGHDVELAVQGLTAPEEASLRARLGEGLSARGFRLVG